MKVPVDLATLAWKILGVLVDLAVERVAGQVLLFVEAGVEMLN